MLLQAAEKTPATQGAHDNSGRAFEEMLKGIEAVAGNCSYAKGFV